MDTQKRLHRSNNKMITGVAAGLAEYFSVDPTLVRLVFLALTLLGGHGALIYLVLWLVMPKAAQVA